MLKATKRKKKAADLCVLQIRFDRETLNQIKAKALSNGLSVPVFVENIVIDFMANNPKLSLLSASVEMMGLFSSKNFRIERIGKKHMEWEDIDRVVSALSNLNSAIANESNKV